MTEAGAAAKSLPMMRRTAILLIFATLPAWAATPDTPAPNVPRWVSQRTDKAYLREGPTYQHKVLWEYRHRGYPFQVIAEFDVWRRVRTPDGTVGWMASSMLSDKRTVVVTGKGRVKLYDRADGAKLVGLADPGAIAPLVACAATACRIKGGGVDGWIAKDRIWGVGADEVFDKIRY